MAILKRKTEQEAETPTRPPREDCDAACPQWAVYRVQIGTVGVLDFCSHHFNRFVAAFMERGWTWKLLGRMRVR